jgi:hypothetical protein
VDIENNMTQLFISYSRKDIAFARRLAGDLEKAGYTVWWDITDLRGGDDWVRVIPEAIETSDFVIVVLSPDATASEWVKKEYTQALSLHKRIIPIMLRTTAVPFALNTINYLDFTSESAYAENLNALLLALGYAGELPVIPAASWPLTLRSLTIPIIVSIVILLAIGTFYLISTPLAPSATATPTGSAVPTLTEVILPTFTVTALPDTPSATSTSSPTRTDTPTGTATSTSTLTPTATATVEVLESLPFCVSRRLSDVSAVNVRTGPGIEYPAFQDALRVGKCLTFWAVSEDGMWMLIADDQADPEMQKFEGGWIRRDLLVTGVNGSISLPVWTLTPTPTPSDTPTITPTLTPSLTPTLTPTLTATTTETETPTP